MPRAQYTHACVYCGVTFVCSHRTQKYCSQTCARTGTKVYRDPVVEFWKRVDVSAVGCWLWLLRPSRTGYGAFMVNGKVVRAHQFSYSLHYGPIPDGFVVCHHCDTPACVRPSHLFLGTQADNVADMCAKGRDRHPVGAANGGARLSEADVLAIRAARRAGASIAALLARYPVSEAAINRVIYRYTWKHLP